MFDGVAACLLVREFGRDAECFPPRGLNLLNKLFGDFGITVDDGDDRTFFRKGTNNCFADSFCPARDEYDLAL